MELDSWMGLEGLEHGDGKFGHLSLLSSSMSRSSIRPLMFRHHHLILSSPGLYLHDPFSTNKIKITRVSPRIMIIEGLPTFLLGLSCYFLLANSPSTAYYLTSQEKTLLTTRLLRQPGQTASGQQMHKKDVLLGLRDWKIYAFCIGQFGADTMLYGYSTFLPTIIQGIGAKSKWTTAQVQALTIPCYALGALTYLLVARLSDAQQVRGPYCVLFGGISVIGYGILLSDAPSGVHYFGCFVVAMGLYVVAGLPLAWLPSNQPRYGKRTTATGLQLMIGNTSGIMAPFVRWGSFSLFLSFRLFAISSSTCAFFHSARDSDFSHDLGFPPFPSPSFLNYCLPPSFAISPKTNISKHRPPSSFLPSSHFPYPITSHLSLLSPPFPNQPSLSISTLHPPQN